MKHSKAGMIVGLYAFFIAPLCALAHATPVEYIPAASATQLETPSSISIRFTERIEVGASSLSVYGPNGEEVSEGKGVIDAQDARILSVPIHDVAEGVYAVSWQVVSVDDGHFTKGAYSFLVDSTGKVFEGGDEKIEIAYSTNLFDVWLSFFSLIGESLFVALFGYLLYARKEIQKKLSILVASVGTLFFLCGGIFSIVRKSIELSALQGVFFPDAVFTYVASSVGTFAVIKLGLAVLFVLVFLFCIQKNILKPLSFVTMGVILGGILYAQSYISHAAASLFAPEISVFATFLHLLAKEGIIGGILLLNILYFASLRKQKIVYAQIAVYFDMWASVLLAVAASTGAFITWLHLKRASNLLLTQWGELFLMLCFSALCFGAFRLVHQFVIHTRLQRIRFSKLYAITLPTEAFLALVVLFYSGYVSMTTPPFEVASYTYEAKVSSGETDFLLQVHPYDHDHFLLTLTEDTTPMPINAFTLLAENVERGIGPNVIQTQERFPGGFAFDRTALSPPGTWRIHAIAQKQGLYDSQAEFTITYPQEVEESAHSDEVRVFDTFALWCLVVCVCMLLASAILFVHARIQLKQTKKQCATFTYTLVYGALTLCACISVCLLLLLAHAVFVDSSFKRACVRDGNAWTQSYPARDFEVTAPNALQGCSVHEGHYHFVDEREYRAFTVEQ